MSSGFQEGLGAATVAAYAYGQAGGNVDSSQTGSGGAGGAANATASATGAGEDPISATATSIGGAGGQGVGFVFVTGNGGNATSSAIGTSTGGGIVTANATSTAGAFGASVNDASPGIMGNATAASSASGGGVSGSSATATGVITSATSSATGGSYASAAALATGKTSSANATASSSGDAIATAFANGSSGNASARAALTSGLFSFVQSNATSPADTIGNAGTEATINATSPAPTVAAATAYESAAFVVAAPLAADVTTAWTSDANAMNAFNASTTNVNALLVSLNQYIHSGSGTAHTYSTIQEIDENNSSLTSNGLIVGMLTPSTIDGGLQTGDSLHFQIQRQGTAILDQTFTTNAALTAYFQNSVLDLGAENANLNGANLDLKFLFDFTSTHPGAGFDEQFAVGNDANVQAGTWSPTSGTSWATPQNWSAKTLPDGPGTQAIFGSAITSPQTVTLDENTTVGSVQFNNSNSYNIAPGTGGYALTLDNAGSAANLSVISGNHTISAPVSVTSAGINANIATGSTLTFAGKITGSGPLALTSAGTLKLGTSIGEVDVTSLSIAPNARLDLTNNHLFIQYGAGSDPVSSIAALLASGYAGGAWNGPGIDTSAPLVTGGLTYGIGYADGADVQHLATGLASGTIEIKYTLLGDADLNGIVNGIDFGILAANFNKGITGWDEGDFDYNNIVNGLDFGDLAANFNKGAAGTAATDALEAFAAANGLMADVPEPGSAALMLIAAGALTRRSRRAARR